MSEAKISIVIPMFNVERFIRTTLDSILLQTFQDFEVIVVDDCSADSSSKIVRNYNDPRIKLFQQIKNSGEGDSRNLGLKIARGKYVYFMDSDDAIVPGMLENFYRAAEESGAEVVYMNSYLRANDPNFTVPGKIDVDKKRFFDPNPRFLSMNLTERLKKEYLEVGVHVVPWMKIQRRDFLLKHKILFPQTLRNSDVLFNFAELCFGEKIQVIDLTGYIYRPSEQSVTRSSSVEKHLQAAIMSIPSAVKFVKGILSSSDLISDIDEDFKMQIEIEVVTRYFKLYVLNAYDGEVSARQIETVLDESLSKQEILSPLFLKTLFNALAIEMIKNEKMGGKV